MIESQRKPVILVIDPDALSLTAISAMLGCNDYEVFCAQDRPAALSGARDLELDLIICDEEIDDCQGAELITELRRIPNRHDVPIMYMSERQMPDIIHRPHDGGAAYHLRKPIDPKVLMELVDSALWQLPLINNKMNNPLPTPHFQMNVIGSLPAIDTTETV